MIFQQYTNAYLLFDDDQPQPLAVRPGRLGSRYAAGRRRYVNRVLLEWEYGRRQQDSILNRVRTRQRFQQQQEQLQQAQRQFTHQRQAAIWATLLTEI